MPPQTDFDYREIDDVIHGRLRLGIMAYLSTASPAVFGELREKVGATDGNLSTHLRKLEEEKYISCKKSFVGRRPMSTYRITSRGRKAFAEHLEVMQRLIKALQR
jgi:DNA-binding MarR family transcriptional regulator